MIVEPDITHSSQTHAEACGHPPQKSGAKYPVNVSSGHDIRSNADGDVQTAVPGVPFYTPHTAPPSGELLNKKADAPKLFEPLTIRNVTFKNRIWVSPMCQYSCETGTGESNMFTARVRLIFLM